MGDRTGGGGGEGTGSGIGVVWRDSRLVKRILGMAELT